MNPTHRPEWYCVRAQTRREHIAAKHLRELDGVEVFCPRLRYRKATKRGKIWWLEPLFPGYLLAKFDLHELERPVQYCQGVRGLVRFGQRTPHIDESFVHQLRQQTQSASQHPSDILDSAPILVIGDEVSFAHGPLQGMSGTVISIAPADQRVRVLLEFLGQTQPIDVDLFSLILPRRPLPAR